MDAPLLLPEVNSAGVRGQQPSLHIIWRRERIHQHPVEFPIAEFPHGESVRWAVFSHSVNRRPFYFSDKRNTMKPNIKACGQAMVTAMVNAVLAVALMLLVEFAISGSFQIPETYLWAGLLIWVVIFAGQFWRQRHLCRSCDTPSESPDPSR